MASSTTNAPAEVPSSDEDTVDTVISVTPPFLFEYKTRRYNMEDVDFIRLIAKDKEAAESATAGSCLGAWCTKCKKKIPYHASRNSKAIVTHISRTHRKFMSKDEKKAAFKMASDVNSAKSITKKIQSKVTSHY